MSCGPYKNDVLAEFNRLADSLAAAGRIEDPDRYAKNFPAFISFLFHIQAYRMAVPWCGGKRVLDIGCFLGYGASMLASYSGRVVACDRDVEVVVSLAAKRKADKAAFLAADALRLPFEDESFEVVTAFQIMEHIHPERVRRFLLELKRVVKKGGAVLITTPNRSFRLLPFQRPFNREHYREYSLRQFRNVLGKVYPGCRITGLSAKKWIEDMEKDRVRQSLIQAYLSDPLSRIARKVLPSGIGSGIRNILNCRSRRGDAEIVAGGRDQFDDCYRLFSMDDIFAAEKDVQQAVEFFAICEKRD